MTELGRVRFGGKTIEYEVRRSARRRKTVRISLERAGVIVTAPKSISKKEVQGIVLEKGTWILDGLDRVPPLPLPRQFVSGETLPYLGRDLSLVVQAAAVDSPSVLAGKKGLMVTAPSSSGGDEHAETVRQALVEWYRERAAEHVGAQVELWWPRLGRDGAPRMLIRDQRSRWGSCAANGILRFNWRLAMLELPLIEYVVVHELAHLSVMNHSPRFWKVVEEALPDVKQRRKRLREAGRDLPL